MDTGMVFVKTDKGHEEIEKRSYHLNFKHRTALIMVDGESAVGALLGKIPGDGTALLEDLLRDGYISAARGEAPDHPAAAPTSGTAAAPAGFDLEVAKRATVVALEAVLGPGGESLAIAIERSSTVADFAAQAKRARDIISQMAGQRKSAEFWAKTGL